MGKSREKENRRKLTPAEQKRKARLEHLEAELTQQDFRKVDLTVGLVFANVMAIVLALPFAIVFLAAYILRNHSGWRFGPVEMILYIVLFFVLIAVHEGIHGITWGWFAPHRMKSVEFGFIKEYMTPYCTCTEPLSRSAYIVGALMPTIVLGILPCVVSVFTGSGLLLLLGISLVFGGGGDMTIVLRLVLHRSKAAETVYIDHPYQAGVIAFER